MTITRSLISLMILLSSAVFAVTISDVSTDQGDSSAIYRVVEQGYFSLLDNKTFQSERPVTRGEMALIIDKLLTEMDGSGATLSKAELQELSALSKHFKRYISDEELTQRKTSQSLEDLKKEQTVIQHDLTDAYGKFDTLNTRSEELIKSNHNFHDDYRQFKQHTHDQQVYTWVGVGLAALLGILL